MMKDSMQNMPRLLCKNSKSAASLLAIMILFSLLTAATEASDYCVKPLPLPRDNLSVLLQAASEDKSPPLRLGEPYMRFVQGINFPIIQSTIQQPLSFKDSTYLSKGIVWWNFEDNPQFFGRRYLLDWNLNDTIAVRTDPLTVWAVGERTLRDGQGTHALGSNEVFQTKIFSTDFRSPFQPLPPEIELTLQWPRAVFWSNLIQGLVVSSYAETKRNYGYFRTMLFKDGKISKLKDGGTSLLQDLTQSNVTASVGDYGLSLLDANGMVIFSFPLNPGDDYGGWDSIRELGDHWLYVGGAQYLYILKLLKDADGWRTGDIYRLIHDSDSDLLSRTLNWLMDFDTEMARKNKLTKVIRLRGGFQYSSSTGSLFSLIVLDSDLGCHKFQ